MAPLTSCFFPFFTFGGKMVSQNSCWRSKGLPYEQRRLVTPASSHEAQAALAIMPCSR